MYTIDSGPYLFLITIRPQQPWTDQKHVNTGSKHCQTSLETKWPKVMYLDLNGAQEESFKIAIYLGQDLGGPDLPQNAARFSIIGLLSG